jgi:hypothetical protein
MAGCRIRVSLVAAVAAAAALGLAPNPAAARPGQIVTFEAPSELADDLQRDATLDEIAALGADGVRLTISWAEAAPDPSASKRPSFDATDPGSYDLAGVDRIVEAARHRGLSVYLTVSGPVPRRATAARRDQLTSPSPLEFERFMTAVGRHFGGRVHAWLVWNEPNHERFLRPQRVNGRPRSPRLYRALYLAARTGLRRAGLHAQTILVGEIAPSSRSAGIAPLAFLRSMLCLNRRYRPARRRCSRLATSGLGVHPYALGPASQSDLQDDQVSIFSLGRLTRALDRAARAGAIRRSLPIYITEFGVQTFPDHLLGIDPVAGAAVRSAAELLAYRNPRVRSFSQYLMRDDADIGGFQTGLRYADGRAKPGYRGFELPLVAQRRSRGAALWGLVRPAPGVTTVRIERSDRHSRWRRAATVRTHRDGSWAIRLGDGATRALWRGVWVAPDGTRLNGPPTPTLSPGSLAPTLMR